MFSRPKTIRFLLLSLSLLPTWAMAQEDNDLRKDYEAFRQQALNDYNDFRTKVNQDYADFVRQAWESFRARPAVPRPKEKTIPPVVIRKEEKRKPLKDKPIVIDKLITPPQPTPQPKPISPIREQEDPTQKSVTITLHGTSMQVRMHDGLKFKLYNLQPESIARQWEQMATPRYNNLIRDCLELRIRHRLCDWSYLQLLDTVSGRLLGTGTNEAELLKAYLYCQSGYKMRLATASNHLYMLYASRHFIFDKPFWVIDGICHYADRCDTQTLQICKATYPHEQALSLHLTSEQALYSKPSEERTLQSEDQASLKATSKTNENLISFFNTYPVSCINDNFMTRWALYANTPMSALARQTLYPQWKALLQGKTMAEAVDMLCHWVQTAFVYEYDDKVWGHDRAFFPDETLFYPYCDCEDRSILLTRMVRDLLGLKCALVYYPGHLATAIAIGEDIQGDHLRIQDEKFIVCDPTYIGAPIGMTMPGMDNTTATVILLNP